jgi:glutathione S-transferase
MKLMYSPTSPYVRRVRAVALELGLADRISLEPVQVAPVRENEAYAATVNPLRKIPALLLDDGSVLIDSTLICAYLDSLAGGDRVIPARAPEHWQVLSQQAIAVGMTDALVLARYEVALRPQELRWPEWLEDQQRRFWSGLAWFERCADAALESRGGACDVSQLALACCLAYADFRFAESGWPVRAPRVSAWYREFMQRSSMSTTAPA